MFECWANNFTITLEMWFIFYCLEPRGEKVEFQMQRDTYPQQSKHLFSFFSFRGLFIAAGRCLENRSCLFFFFFAWPTHIWWWLPKMNSSLINCSSTRKKLHQKLKNLGKLIKYFVPWGVTRTLYVTSITSIYILLIPNTEFSERISWLQKIHSLDIL